MVTVKGTNFGVEGGAFKDSLARLRQQVNDKKGSFLKLGNDDAFTNRLSELSATGSRFSERAATLGGFGNEVNQLNADKEKVAASAQVQSRLESTLTKLDSFKEGSEEFELAKREVAGLNKELSNLGVEPGETPVAKEKPNKPGRPTPKDPSKGLPGTEDELIGLREKESEKLADLDSKISENNTRNDELGDKIDSLSSELEETTDEERRSEIEKELKGLNKQRRGNDAEFQKLSEAATFSQERINAIDEKLGEIGSGEGGNDRASQLRSELNKNNKRLDELGKENEDLSKRIDAAGEQLVKIKEDLTAAKENPDLLSAEDRKALESKRDELQTEIDGLTEKKTGLEKSIAAGREEIVGIQKERESRSGDVLNDKDQGKIEKDIAKLEKKIEPLAKRSEALGKLIGKIGEGRAELGEKRTELQGIIENSDDEAAKKRARKELSVVNKADKILEESESFLTKKRDKIEGKIAGEREEIQAGRDRIAKSDEAKEVIAAGQEREAALNKEIGVAEEDLAGVNETLGGLNDKQSGVVGTLDADATARQTISDLEARQTRVTEGRENDRKQIGANDEEAQALKERNEELQAELDKISGGNDDGGRAARIKELEKRNEEIEKRSGVLQEERAGVVEARDAAQAFLDKAPSDDDLDEQEKEFGVDKAKAEKDIEKFDDKNKFKVAILTIGEKVARAGAAEAEKKGNFKLAEKLTKVADVLKSKLDDIGADRQKIVDRKDRAEEGLKGVADTREQKSQAAETVSTSGDRLEKIDTETKALGAERGRNDKELEELKAGGSVGGSAKTPAEAREALEKRLEELEKRGQEIAKREEELVKLDGDLAEKEVDALARVDAATGTLEGLRSNDELDDAQKSLSEKKDALVADREDLFSDKTGKKLQGELDKVQKDLEKAADFREKGDEKQALKFEAKAAKRLAKVKDDDKLGARLKEVEAVDQSIKEVDSEIGAVEAERTLRSETEAELGNAKKELSEVQSQRSDIASERDDLKTQREGDKQEVGEINDALDTSDPLGAIDVDEDIGSLDNNTRRERSEEVSDQIGKNNKRLDEIDSQLERIAASEDRISTLTGKAEKQGLSSDEQEELDDLLERRESRLDQRVVLEDERETVETANEGLRDFNKSLRKVDDGPNPPATEEPNPGTGVAQLKGSIEASIAGSVAFQESETARISVKQDEIASRLQQKQNEVRIDVFAGQSGAAAASDASLLAENLAKDVADQIRQLGQRGQGGNAIEAALSNVTDVNKLNDRLRSLFA